MRHIVTNFRNIFKPNAEKRVRAAIRKLLEDAFSNAPPDKTQLNYVFTLGNCTAISLLKEYLFHFSIYPAMFIVE